MKNQIKKLLPDKIYLKHKFKKVMGRKLDFKNLKTYNEKLQWLKIHDRKEYYVRLVDKYEVKSYVSNIIGQNYIIPTIGVWDSFEDIDFDALPNQFVLKCTHDSGGIVICKDKKNFDMQNASNKISKSLQSNYYWSGREWPYKNVKPKIIAEKYMEDEKTKELQDFKFFVFDGEIDCIMVCVGRSKGKPQFIYYDTEWNRLIYQDSEPKFDIEKPKNLGKMIEIVNKLSKEFIHIRIDLFNVNGQIYFGEYTFYNDSGFDRDISYCTDLMWGKKIKIPLR